jgi:DNA-binding NtrC family response regulator
MTSRAKFGRILLVSDALNTLSNLQRLLEWEGLAVGTAYAGEETGQRLEQEACDLIILDQNSPVADNTASPRGPSLSSRIVLDSVCTAYESVNSAVATIKEAAYSDLPWHAHNGSTKRGESGTGKELIAGAITSQLKT